MPLVARINSFPTDLPTNSLVGDYLQVYEWHLPQTFDDAYLEISLEICSLVAKIGIDNRIWTYSIKGGVTTCGAYDSLHVCRIFENWGMTIWVPFHTTFSIYLILVRYSVQTFHSFPDKEEGTFLPF